MGIGGLEQGGPRLLLADPGWAGAEKLRLDGKNMLGSGTVGVNGK